MLRMAFIIIVIATVVGAVMPSGEPSAADDRRKPMRVEELDSGSSSQTIESGAGTITLQRSDDGHFYADARVNGTSVHFLVDTGATGIALSESDARRAGMMFHASQAEVIGTGASGQVLGHYVRLNRVELGHASVHDAPAVVLQDGDRSLLGQSFLSRFDSVEIQGDTMVLR
jgi:aspartyl protease family protein